MTAVLGLLEWIGARARWVLALGVIAATLMPALSAALRPVLPLLVVLVLALAMARMELGQVARAALRPRRLGRLVLWAAALMVLTPAMFWAAGRLAGLAEGEIAALVYTGAAPPITSAVSLCLILGLDAVFALELTVLATLALPLIGPIVVEALIGAAVPIDAARLALRLGMMIAGGAALALLLRRLVGPARIRARARAFDGLAALAMIVFVIPLFDGFWRLMLADPVQSLRVVLLVLATNTGLMLAVAAGLARAGPRARAHAAGLMWGNRTVALYLAALPAEPLFTLYVALYQFPMLFTPLVMERVFGRAPPEADTA
ncbi:MAG TPA: hypothetical protein VMM55_10240 [Thermohalobaculum sp.]|nr:hypothetical protein [Thermohalobaculum sp.]